MKITEIKAVRLNVPPKVESVPARRPSWWVETEVANPMSRYPRVKRHRDLWRPPWEQVWVKVTLEDGTWGLGQTDHGRAVAAIVDDHLGPQLVGEDALAHDRIADMLFRLTKPYGTTGLASFAISGIDLALWDARGKVYQQPVYRLLGGPQKDRLFVYATGNDVDWYQELGFRAFKLACPHGPADGLDGMRRNEELVARARETVGDEAELMLDCWMAFDVEYTVRLAETLRPYRLRWIEECLIPEDFDAHLALRARLPWQGLATGEHWFTHVPFQWAMAHRAVDIVQPDINWVGGISTCVKIAGMAEAAGVSMILHAGGNTVFGQHFSYASAAVPWLEFLPRTGVGVPVADSDHVLPGQPVPANGWLVPSDAPGFGLEVAESAIVPFFA